MEELNSSTNLTDGPIWAEVANRLQNHSALELTQRLCNPEPDTTESPEKAATPKPDSPFPNGQYYYYTFKKDGADTGPFIIERNLVTFGRNGNVSILASGILYEGYAYHLHKTLRLSLSNTRKGGFLEVFLELIDDRADLSANKVLYGMSLWRSSSRIQGKTVVLSRIEKVAQKELNLKTEVFSFLKSDNKKFEKETKRIADEDQRGGGIMSYLRGQINRYMHATTHSSPEYIRPRDESFRKMHFLIACYYGLPAPNALARRRYQRI